MITSFSIAAMEFPRNPAKWFRINKMKIQQSSKEREREEERRVDMRLNAGWYENKYTHKIRDSSAASTR